MIIKGGPDPHPPCFAQLILIYIGILLWQASSLCDFLTIFGGPEKCVTQETFLIIVGQICVVLIAPPARRFQLHNDTFVKVFG